MFRATCSFLPISCEQLVSYPVVDDLLPPALVSSPAFLQVPPAFLQVFSEFSYKVPPAFLQAPHLVCGYVLLAIGMKIEFGQLTHLEYYALIS